MNGKHKADTVERSQLQDNVDECIEDEFEFDDDLDSLGSLYDDSDELEDFEDSDSDLFTYPAEGAHTLLDPLEDDLD